VTVVVPTWRRITWWLGAFMAVVLLSAPMWAGAERRWVLFGGGVILGIVFFVLSPAAPWRAGPTSAADPPQATETTTQPSLAALFVVLLALPIAAVALFALAGLTWFVAPFALGLPVLAAAWWFHRRAHRRRPPPKA
jgi:hypothetical protein